MNRRKFLSSSLAIGSSFVLPEKLLGLDRPASTIAAAQTAPPIELTESGCSYLDAPYAKEGGQVPDACRIAFFRSYLTELARAISDGAKVRAYHAWTLLDNFEWADGYSQRYGLTYVDFRDQSRTVKASGHWYGRIAAANRLDV